MQGNLTRRLKVQKRQRPPGPQHRPSFDVPFETLVGSARVNRAQGIGSWVDGREGFDYH